MRLSTIFCKYRQLHSFEQYTTAVFFTSSIHRAAVAENLLAAYGVMLTLAGITGITLDGVDHAVLAFFYDADVVAASVAFPIEENQIARLRQIVSVLPLPVFLEPSHAVRTKREFRDNARVNIAALIGTPRHITGTPRDARLEAVP